MRERELKKGKRTGDKQTEREIDEERERQRNRCVCLKKRIQHDHDIRTYIRTNHFHIYAGVICCL